MRVIISQDRSPRGSLIAPLIYWYKNLWITYTVALNFIRFFTILFTYYLQACPINNSWVLSLYLVENMFKTIRGSLRAILLLSIFLTAVYAGEFEQRNRIPFCHPTPGSNTPLTAYRLPCWPMSSRTRSNCSFIWVSCLLFALYQPINPNYYLDKNFD